MRPVPDSMTIPPLKEMMSVSKKILDDIAADMPKRGDKDDKITADEHEMMHKLRVTVFWEQFGKWLSDNCTEADIDDMRQKHDEYWPEFESFRVRCLTRRRKIDSKHRP